MSHEITAGVFKFSRAKGTKRLLLVVLADQANAWGVSFPGVGTLADYANVDARRVSDHITGLEAMGELFVYRREGLHNVYVVLPGLSVDQRVQAVAFINTQFRGDGEMLTIDDLPLTKVSGGPPTKPAGVTPDESVGGENGEPLTEPAGVPLTEPSAPPDGSVSRSKDSVVVDQESPDPPDHQQQEPATVREPVQVERELFASSHIGKGIWQRWMVHEPVAVVAAMLHATEEGGVRSPVGLMRAILDLGSAAPKQKYVKAARERLGLEYDEEMAYIRAMEAAGWDPRRVVHDPNGRWCTLAAEGG